MNLQHLPFVYLMKVSSGKGSLFVIGDILQCFEKSGSGHISLDVNLLLFVTHPSFINFSNDR